jgi:choline dehydrogenase-like flavoprotein
LVTLISYQTDNGTDGETTKKHNAPIFQGGTPLSKSALASEAENIRHTVPEKYRRISRPVPMMRTEYDVVVVGSGYGGAVAASRMSRAGKSVCLLELGKERWPGEYPVDFVSATPEIHISGNIEKNSKLSRFDSGDPQGLYHLILGEGQNAFVANGKKFDLDHLLIISGLGGTSLLNANVFLQADHRTLSKAAFPPEIRNDPSCLDECMLIL